MMAMVMFYHLTRSPAALTLANILPRARAQGWRVMLRGTDPARLADLDQSLWQAQEFLPHGLAGGPQDDDQPILLGTDLQGTGALPADCQAMVLIDGALCTPAEAQALERVWILFDGDNPQAVEAARGQWRALTAAGLPAQYWSEETGKWHKKTEKSAG